MAKMTNPLKGLTVVDLGVGMAAALTAYFEGLDPATPGDLSGRRRQLQFGRAASACPKTRHSGSGPTTRSECSRPAGTSNDSPAE
jgi:hypothetical protein